MISDKQTKEQIMWALTAINDSIERMARAIRVPLEQATMDGMKTSLVRSYLRWTEYEY